MPRWARQLAVAVVLGLARWTGREAAAGWSVPAVLVRLSLSVVAAVMLLPAMAAPVQLAMMLCQSVLETAVCYPLGPVCR